MPHYSTFDITSDNFQEAPNFHHWTGALHHLLTPESHSAEEMKIEADRLKSIARRRMAIYGLSGSLAAFQAFIYKDPGQKALSQSQLYPHNATGMEYINWYPVSAGVSSNFLLGAQCIQALLCKLFLSRFDSAAEQFLKSEGTAESVRYFSQAASVITVALALTSVTPFYVLALTDSFVEGESLAVKNLYAFVTVILSLTPIHWTGLDEIKTLIGKIIGELSSEESLATDKARESLLSLINNSKESFLNNDFSNHASQHKVPSVDAMKEANTVMATLKKLLETDPENQNAIENCIKNFMMTLFKLSPENQNLSPQSLAEKFEANARTWTVRLKDHLSQIKNEVPQRKSKILAGTITGALLGALTAQGFHAEDETPNYAAFIPSLGLFGSALGAIDGATQLAYQVGFFGAVTLPTSGYAYEAGVGMESAGLLISKAELFGNFSLDQIISTISDNCDITGCNFTQNSPAEFAQAMESSKAFAESLYRTFYTLAFVPLGGLSVKSSPGIARGIQGTIVEFGTAFFQFITCKDTETRHKIVRETLLPKATKLASFLAVLLTAGSGPTNSYVTEKYMKPEMHKDNPSLYTLGLMLYTLSWVSPVAVNWWYGQEVVKELSAVLGFSTLQGEEKTFHDSLKIFEALEAHFKNMSSHNIRDSFRDLYRQDEAVMKSAAARHGMSEHGLDILLGKAQGKPAQAKGLFGSIAAFFTGNKPNPKEGIPLNQFKM